LIAIGWLSDAAVIRPRRVTPTRIHRWWMMKIPCPRAAGFCVLDLSGSPHKDRVYPRTGVLERPGPRGPHRPGHEHCAVQILAWRSPGPPGVSRPAPRGVHEQGRERRVVWCSFSRRPPAVILDTKGRRPRFGIRRHNYCPTNSRCEKPDGTGISDSIFDDDTSPQPRDLE